MKETIRKILSNGAIVLLIIAVLYIIFLRECKQTTCPPKGQILVSKVVWDSVQTLANKPPVIKIDTFLIKGKTIYVNNNPLPKPISDKKDSTINNYQDSLIRKDINVHINLTIKGQLLDRKWEYMPIISEIVKNTTVYVPKIINNPVETSRNKLFISANVGGNANSFLFGGGVDFITKKNTEIGYIYQRYGNINFHSIKVGIIIKLRK
jgi:hypothetical protein